jgi:hypothetical protein
MRQIIFKLFGNRILPMDTGILPIISGVSPGEQADDVATVGQLVSSDGSLIKGFGNTGTSAEDGDYRLVTNSSNEFVSQFRVLGSWDTGNETILATPS